MRRISASISRMAVWSSMITMRLAEVRVGTGDEERNRERCGDFWISAGKLNPISKKTPAGKCRANALLRNGYGGQPSRCALLGEGWWGDWDSNPEPIA